MDGREDFLGTVLPPFRTSPALLCHARALLS